LTKSFGTNLAVDEKAHSTGDDLLAKFDLTEAASRPISQFSSGMRRRLDLAASLMTRPALIFLDEPTTGLAPPGLAARCGTRSAT
jgi:ABC-type multidrug transport system ATPase subunit